MDCRLALAQQRWQWQQRVNRRIRLGSSCRRVAALSIACLLQFAARRAVSTSCFAVLDEWWSHRWLQSIARSDPKLPPPPSIRCWPPTHDRPNAVATLH